ncbi:MAG: hypothetical protein HDR84_00620 [Bacteroides sp.]|nr:hypothetical protein [Bacteroides sp.]
MRKLIFVAIALLTSLVSQGITVEEAFKKISALPGASAENISGLDLEALGLDYGRQVVFIGNESTDRVLAVKDEITGAELSEVNDQKYPVYIFLQSIPAEKMALFTVTLHPMGPVCMLIKGSVDAVQNLGKD